MPAFVRWTHWITALCFLALLITGVEILISHPRFYWGETGDPSTPALFQIPIPASRRYVQTGYTYVLPDQNGWSRALHFQSAWIVLFAGAVYLIAGFLRGHFRRHLWPDAFSVSAVRDSLRQHFQLAALRLVPPGHYNLIQRLSYLKVVFLLFPLMIWTGIAMSPSFSAAFPITVNSLGGHQSARTIHFFATLALTLFAIIHVAMVALTGFRPRLRAMIFGKPQA